VAAAGDLAALRTHSTRTRDRHGSPLLHYAAGGGNLPACRFPAGLKNASGDRLLRPEGRNNGQTALHWAARNGSTKTCRLLTSGLFGEGKGDPPAAGNVAVSF